MQPEVQGLKRTHLIMSYNKREIYRESWVRKYRGGLRMGVKEKIAEEKVSVGA